MRGVAFCSLFISLFISLSYRSVVAIAIGARPSITPISLSQSLPGRSVAARAIGKHSDRHRPPSISVLSRRCGRGVAGEVGELFCIGLARCRGSGRSDEKLRDVDPDKKHKLGKNYLEAGPIILVRGPEAMVWCYLVGSQPPSPQKIANPRISRIFSRKIAFWVEKIQNDTWFF